jgi:hypothetical protein
MLSQIPPPRPEDVKHRSERTPMHRADRRRFFRLHATGLCLLIATYALLTIMRSIRDDFAVEIYEDLGEGGKPAIFAYTETLVMLGVVLINGAAILIYDNRRALQTALVTILAGFVVVALSVGGYTLDWLGGLPFMILTGIGMYVPYVAFHTTLFERMIAVFRDKSNIGYLMYLADAIGYLSYVAVMLFRDLSQVATVQRWLPWFQATTHLDFFLRATLVICALSIVMMICSFVYFRWKMAVQVTAEDPHQPGPAAARLSPPDGN